MSKSYFNKLLFSLLLVLGLSACAQMNSTQSGALGGAALGSGLGAIIGHQTGNAGVGTAIGGTLGLLTGGLFGNKTDRQRTRSSDMDARMARQQRELEKNKKEITELRRRYAQDQVRAAEERERRAREQDAKLRRALEAEKKRKDRKLAQTVKKQPKESVEVEKETNDPMPTSISNASAWTVQKVQGSNVTVVRKAGDTPKSSDLVEIYFMIEDINVKARKATGKIKQVTASNFTVAVDPDSVTGEIEVGNLVGPVN